MSHMVIYRSADGKPKYQQVDDLQGAVTFVEKLRNAEGVENARIFRLEQVNFRFEPYYQVRIEAPEQQQAVPPPPPVAVPSATAHDSSGAASEPPASAPAVDLTSPPPAPPAAADPAEEPTPAPDPSTAGTENTEANGVRRGLFGR